MTRWICECDIRECDGQQGEGGSVFHTTHQNDKSTHLWVMVAIFLFPNSYFSFASSVFFQIFNKEKLIM